jgi:hypothetical protein
MKFQILVEIFIKFYNTIILALYFFGITIVLALHLHVPFTKAFLDSLYSENGFFETMTALLFVTIAISSFQYYIKKREKKIFLIIACLGIFCAGEELSWGQHYFAFPTSVWINKVNVQQEFNLHNIGYTFHTITLPILGNALDGGRVVLISIFLYFILNITRENIFSKRFSYFVLINMLLIPIDPERFSEVFEYIFTWFILLAVYRSTLVAYHSPSPKWKEDLKNLVNEFHMTMKPEALPDKKSEHLS